MDLNNIDDTILFNNMASGKLYELAVFTHTLLNNPNKQFDLGIEIKVADKFDDLGIRVNGNQYTFTQIKLVDNAESNAIDSKVLLGEKRISLKKEDFKLQKYFVSYLRLKDQLNSRDESNAIHKLIIFTNAHLDEKDVSKEIGNLKRIKYSNNTILAPNEDLVFYKISNMSGAFIHKMMKSVKCDLQILVEEIAKYVTDSSNQDPMVLDVDCFRYYHRALIEEKVMEVGESQQGNKKIKLGKFTQNFINGNELSKRAQKLRNKLLDFLLGKQNNIQRLQDNMAKAEWKLADDFGSTESKDVIFLPEYEISDKDIKDFFGILELRVNQLDVKDIFMKIKHEEIKNRFVEYFDTDPKLVEFLINDYVQGWRNQGIMLEKWLLNSERSDFIKKLQVKIAKPQAIHTTNKHVKYIESIIKKYNLHFRADCSFNEKYFLRKKYLVISTASNVLSSIKMLEYLNRTKHQSYIFIHLESLSDKREIVKLIDAFRDVNYTLFILSYKNLIEDDIINEIFNKLSSVMQGSNKQTVFITSNVDSRIKRFDGYQEYTDTITGIEDFLDSSKILEQKITIQGQVVQVGDLCRQICPKIIDQLITSKIDIGNTSEMNYLEGAYSELFEEVNMESFVAAILLQKLSDIYIISGIHGERKTDRLIKEIGLTNNTTINTIKHLTEVLEHDRKKTMNGKIYVCSDQFKYREFKQACRYNAKKKIYWINLKHEGDKPKFILVQIYNPNFYIKGKRFNIGIATKKSITERLVRTDLREIFFISGTNKTDFESWLQLNDGERKQFEINYSCKKINFTSPHEYQSITFQELVQQNLDETVHLLKFDKDRLIWCKTHETLETSSVFGSDDYMDTPYLLEDDIIKAIKDKQVVIIAGEPGIGKSTALVKLYGSNYKLRSGIEVSINKSHWVIRVKLKDHLQLIRDIDFRHSDEISIVVPEVIKFLSQVDTTLEEDVAKNLLGAALINQNFGKPLLIAFDGFDEVLDNDDRDKVISLLKNLKDKTKTKFWITTRLHCENILESELSTFAIRLEAMDVDNVRLFIKTYLKGHLSLTLNHEEFTRIFTDIDGKENSNVLHIYTEAFLNKMQEIFKGDITWFIGTPLQLYLMLEGSPKYFTQWAIDNSCVTPDFSYLGNDIYEVYEKFIERKYDTYFKKSEIKEHVKQKLEKTVLDDFHKDLAKSLLLESEVKISLAELKDIILSAGIVRSDGRDQNIEFIHPTFREFYAAKICLSWIKKWAKKRMYKLSNAHEKLYVFQDILSNPVHQVVRAFINVKLVDEEINESLNLKEQYYNKHTLYLAFRECNFGIASFLLTICDFRNVNEGAIYDSESPLKYAAFYGDIEKLKLLVKYSTSIDSPDKLYSSVLHVAAESGQLDLLIFLLENGADVNTRNAKGETAIFRLFSVSRSPWYVQRDLEIAKFLVQNGADVNICNARGESPLCSAVFKRNNVEKVKFLLENYADVNNYNGRGKSPLGTVSNYVEIKKVEFSLENSAEYVNTKRENSKIPLISAIKNSDFEIVRCLVENGADVNHKTVLSYALYHEENFEMIKFLVQYGADVHSASSSGQSLLCKASYLDLSLNKSINLLTFLVHKGMKIDSTDRNDRFVLKRVVESGNFDLLKLLIDTRSNVDLDVLCPLLLHDAARSNNLDMVKYLVDYDAQVNAKLNSGRTDGNPVWSELPDFKIVRHLLYNSTNFNAKDSDRRSVLHYAAKCNNLEMVEYFVENGASYNAKDKDGFTVLHYAAKCNNLEMIQYLIENDADIDSKAKYGMTALHCAVFVANADLNVVKYLVEKGVEMNATTSIQQTALHLAVLNGYTGIVEYLLKEGADITLKDRDGWNALEMAVNWDLDDIIKLFLSSDKHLESNTTNNRNTI